MQGLHILAEFHDCACVAGPMLDAGELGEEGIQTVMRLGGTTITELKRIVFRPAPKDD